MGWVLMGGWVVVKKMAGDSRGEWGEKDASDKMGVCVQRNRLDGDREYELTKLTVTDQ